MRALFALRDCFVATIISVLLALGAKLMFFMCLDATFVFTLLAFGFSFHTAALSGKSGAGTHNKRHCKGKSCKCPGQLHFSFSIVFCFLGLQPHHFTGAAASRELV